MVEALLQLGSMRYPDAPQSSGIHRHTGGPYRPLALQTAQHMTSVWISKNSQNDCFAIVFPIENVDGVASSKQNLQGGQECRFIVKNFAEEGGESKARRCYFAFEYCCILELKAGSVTLLNWAACKWGKPFRYKKPCHVRAGLDMCVTSCTFTICAWTSAS